MSDVSDERVREWAGREGYDDDDLDGIPEKHFTAQVWAVKFARKVLALQERVAGMKGAIRADEYRLNAAATKVWGENVHGCDAPDWLAEEILGLRAQVAALTRQHAVAVAVAREALLLACHNGCASCEGRGDVNGAQCPACDGGRNIAAVTDLRTRLAEAVNGEVAPCSDP